MCDPLPHYVFQEIEDINEMLWDYPDAQVEFKKGHIVVPYTDNVLPLSVKKCIDAMNDILDEHSHAIEEIYMTEVEGRKFFVCKIWDDDKEEEIIENFLHNIKTEIFDVEVEIPKDEKESARILKKLHNHVLDKKDLDEFLPHYAIRSAEDAMELGGFFIARLKHYHKVYHPVRFLDKKCYTLTNGLILKGWDFIGPINQVN